MGTVDACQLHDVVGDFVQQQHTAVELRQAHRRMVQLIRERRPKGGYVEKEDPFSRYVTYELPYHIRESWDLERPDWDTDTQGLSWLDDFPRGQDVVPISTALVLGFERTATLARQAEAAGDFWKASLRWTATAEIAKSTRSSSDEYRQPLLASAAALEKVPPQDDKHRLELIVLIRILTMWNPSDYSYLPRLTPILESHIGSESPEVKFQGIMLAEWWPAIFQGQYDNHAVGLISIKMLDCGKESAANIPELTLKNVEAERCKMLCPAMLVVVLWLDFMVRSGRFSWDAHFGIGGELMKRLSKMYTYEGMHDYIVSMVTLDSLCIGTVLPLLFHWGDLPSANENMDRSLACYRLLASEFRTAGHVKHANSFMMSSGYLFYSMWLLGREADCLAIMEESGFAIDEIDATYDLFGANSEFSRLRGAPNDLDTTDGKVFDVVATSHQTRAFHTLMSGDPRGVEHIPPPDELVAMGMAGLPGRPMHLIVQHSWGATTWPALAFERLGMAEQALAFAAKSLETVLQKGGNKVVWTRVLAHGCRGRVLAGLGRMKEAEAAFDAAMVEMRGCEYWFFEAWILHDLTERVLAPNGRRAEGQLHLDTVVGKLVGPVVEPLLQGRFAAWSEMIPLLEGAGREEDESTTQAGDAGITTELETLRAELTPLKLSALKKVAVAQGVSADAIEQLDDSDNPKQAAISLLLHEKEKELLATAQSAAGEVVVDAELQKVREELTPMKMRALRQKAIEEHGIEKSVVADLMDDSDDPKADLLALLLDAKRSELCAAATEAQTAQSFAADLEMQLKAMAIKKLRAKAKELGATSDQLDDAAENEDQKSVLVSLLMELRPTEEAEEAEPEPELEPQPAADVAELRLVLATLTVKELRAKAKAGGTSSEQLDDAAESEDQKSVLVALVTGLEAEAHQAALAVAP